MVQIIFKKNIFKRSDLTRKTSDELTLLINK